MCLGVGKWLECELSTDQLGTQRTRSAQLATNLLCELSRPLPCFSWCQGKKPQKCGFLGMMLNHFELQNLQLDCFNVV